MEIDPIRESVLKLNNPNITVTPKKNGPVIRIIVYTPNPSVDGGNKTWYPKSCGSWEAALDMAIMFEARINRGIKFVPVNDSENNSDLKKKIKLLEERFSMVERSRNGLTSRVQVLTKELKDYESKMMHLVASFMNNIPNDIRKKF